MRCLLTILALLWTTTNSATEVFVLGIAQDGGYPQAGCFRPHCIPGWENVGAAKSVTSLAIIDSERKLSWLVDATPDLPQQLYRLRQRAEQASLSGIFLTHAHIGHYTGLIHLGREAMGAKNMPVYAMPRMAAFLRTNGPWSQLVQLNNIRIQLLAHQQPLDLGQGLTVTPLLVPHRDEFSETVGFSIASEQSLLFIPDIDKWSKWDTDIRQLIRQHDYALLDATFFGQAELPNRDMSEIPHPFVEESIALFQSLDAVDRDKIFFIHLNHSNPLLREDSVASATVKAAGMNVAREGMTFSLAREKSTVPVRE